VEIGMEYMVDPMGGMQMATIRAKVEGLRGTRTTGRKEIATNDGVGVGVLDDGINTAMEVGTERRHTTAVMTVIGITAIVTGTGGRMTAGTLLA